MPKRNSYKERNEVNRRQRKQRWIRAKNLMRRHPECAYNGDFYCNHVYDEERGWAWVDFRFFHTSQKRYFSVAMVTCELDAYEQVENDCLTAASAQFPYEGLQSVFQPATGLYQLVFSESDYARHRLTDSLTREAILAGGHTSRESITIRDYGPVAVGVKAVVNTPFIDEHYIRRFIGFFRSLGEPITPGQIFTGPTINVNLEKYLQQNSCSAEC